MCGKEQGEPEEKQLGELEKTETSVKYLNAPKVTKHLDGLPSGSSCRTCFGCCTPFPTMIGLEKTDLSSPAFARTASE